MSETLALPLLFDAVAARFALDESPVVFEYGWKEAAKQLNQGPDGAARIVFVPGDEKFKLGKDLPVDKPGRNPRSLGTLEELFTVFIWAVDATATTERAQASAARKLYDQWYRAAYLATHTDGDNGLGPLTIVDQRWNKEKIESSFGAEIIVTATIQAAILDEADDVTTESDHVGFRGPLVELGETQMIITPTP